MKLAKDVKKTKPGILSVKDRTKAVDLAKKKGKKPGKDVENFDKKFGTQIKDKASSMEKAIAKKVKDYIKSQKIPKDQEEKVKGMLTALLKEHKQYAGDFTARSDKLEYAVNKKAELTSALAELQEEYDLLDEQSEDDLDSDDLTRKIEIEEEIEEKEDEIYKVDKNISKLQTVTQQVYQKTKAAAEEAFSQIEAVIELNADDLTEIDGADTSPAFLLDLAKEQYTTALKAWSRWVSSKIPNDTSVEKDLYKVATEFASAEKLTRQIAKLYARDQVASASIISLASMVGLPGKAIQTAMEANDRLPKVADTEEPDDEDWEKSIDDFMTKSKDTERAKKDSKSFIGAMKSIEPEYARTLEFLPTSGKAKQIVNVVGVYKAATNRLQTVSDSVKDEYPALNAVLDAAVLVGKRHVAIIKKAMTS